MGRAFCPALRQAKKAAGASGQARCAGDPDDSHSRYLEAAVILAGDYNIIPTPTDVYQPECWIELS